MGIESLIPIAASAIGAFGGSKGQQSQQQTRQEMDPRMVPYIFGSGGQGGLLSGVQNQLAASQSPERMAQWDMMRNRGMGLLGGGVAGNPFFAGYQGGSFHGNVNPAQMQNGLLRYAPPSAPAPAAAPAAPPSSFNPPTIDQMLAQMQQRGNNNWQDMPGGA